MVIEFIIEKYVMWIPKNGKREITERIELPNQEGFGMLGEKKNYKYLGILEADTIRDEKKKKKRLPQKNAKARSQARQWKFHYRNKHLGT